jgi:3-mercaptopyruvate sulfurtransferase SseA
MSRLLSRLLPGLLLVAWGSAAHRAAAVEAKPTPSPTATTAPQAADAAPASGAQAPQTDAVPSDTDQVPRKSLDEAEALQKSGGALFLDVRDAASYGTGHIKGAINIPLDVLGERLQELPHDKPIITYCG